MRSLRDYLPPGWPTKRDSAAKVKWGDIAAFVAAVEDIFRDEEDKYVIFWKILADVRTDSAEKFAQVKDLLKGHNYLIRWFHNLVPDYGGPPREIGFLCNNILSYVQGFVFHEKVKKRLGKFDEYQTFLNCMQDFAVDTMRNHDLQNSVKGILREHPDLMNEFIWFLENVDVDKFLAGALSKSMRNSLIPFLLLSCTDGRVPVNGYCPVASSKTACLYVAESLDVEGEEVEQKTRVSGNGKKVMGKEKYNSISIHDLDFSDCQSCTPSYRLLPADYPIASSSHRSELECEVLNDHCIAVPSGSEEGKHGHKNNYEERLFKCEDDRFELDMLLESYISCAKHAVEFLKMINGNGVDPNNPILIEDYFTPGNLRCIEKMYGDHGLEVIDILHTNPTVAVPVILVRLKENEKKGIEFQEGIKEKWAEIYARNHSKLLDLYRKSERPEKMNRIKDNGPVRRQLGVKHSSRLTSLAYMKEVHESFQDQKEIYNMFITLMNDFKAQRIDSAGLHARVEELFKGHTDLIRGFSTFLSTWYEINIHEDRAPPKIEIDLNEPLRCLNSSKLTKDGLAYLKKVRETLQDQKQIYEMFLMLMEDIKARRTDMAGVHARVREIFKGHTDLILGFNTFLPKGREINLHED